MSVPSRSKEEMTISACWPKYVESYFAIYYRDSRSRARLRGTLNDLRELFDVEPRRPWDMFGDCFHALVINALLMFGVILGEHDGG